MTSFWGHRGESRRDGEKLINWDIDTENISMDELRDMIKHNLSTKKIKSRRSPVTSFMKSQKVAKTPSLTKALSAVMEEKASLIPVVREFCDRVGMDAERSTVRDVVIQCQLFYALSGSAPHFMHLFDRVEGKIPNQTEVKLDGRAGISEAMAAMMGAVSAPEQLEYEESDPEHMDMLAGTKNTEAEVVENEESEFEDSDEDMEDEDNV